ncbi:MAG: T9SS type A sorting domain-containing protein, partial [Cyclobacteriaceae bacterium]
DPEVKNNVYYWYQDNQLIKTTQTNRLSIDNFLPDMEGNYRCEVVNSNFQVGDDPSQRVTLYYDSIRVKSEGRLPQLITVEKIDNKTFGDPPFSIVASSNTTIDLQYAVEEGPVQLLNDEVTIKGAGEAAVRVFAPGNETYDPADTIIRFTIARATQNIQFEQPEDITVNTDSLSMVVESSSKLPVTLQVKEGKVSVKEQVVFIEGAGQVVLEASQLGNDNYQAAKPVTIRFNVLKATQEIIFAEITDKRYGDQDFPLTVYSSVDLPIDLQALTDNISITDNQVSIVGAGEASIQATQSGNSDYTAATSITRSFFIEKAEQFIAMDSLGDQNILDKSFTFWVQASSELPVTIEATFGSEHVSIQDSTITFLSEGEVTIMVSQPGNENYQPAIPLSQTFNIYNPTKQEQSILVSSEVPEKPERETYYRYEVTTTSGLPPKVEVTGPGEWQNNQIIFTAIGEVIVKIFQEGNDVYNAAPVFEQQFNISKKEQTIEVTAFSEIEVHDANNPYLLEANASSGLPVSVQVVEGEALVAGLQLICPVEDSVTLMFVQSGDDEYQEAEPVYLSFIVIPRQKQEQQIVSQTEFTNLAYEDGPMPLEIQSSSNLPLTYQHTGPISVRNDSLFIEGAGDASLSVYQAGDDEYLPDTLTLEFSISKAAQEILLEIVATNDTTYQLLATTSSGLPAQFSLLEGSARIEGELLYVTQSGTVTVEARQPGNDNYEAATPVQRTLEIELVLGLAEEQLPDIRYYPNPVINTVSLVRNGNFSEAQVYLFDHLGKQVLRKHWNAPELQLDLSPLSEGVYLLYYQETIGRSRSIRLIKE